MSIDKKMNYEIQAGVKNYKPSKMVTVPKEAKSSPTHPTAKLAYITDAEKKLLIKKNLHGSLKGKPNRGPGGIPSLQGDFGPGGRDFGGFRGGGDYSSAETGNFSGFDGTFTPSNLLVIVAVLSSAAKIPFPFSKILRAISFNSDMLL